MFYLILSQTHLPQHDIIFHFNSLSSPLVCIMGIFSRSVSLCTSPMLGCRRFLQKGCMLASCSVLWDLSARTRFDVNLFFSEFLHHGDKDKFVLHLCMKHRIGVLILRDDSFLPIYCLGWAGFAFASLGGWVEFLLVSFSQSGQPFEALVLCQGFCSTVLPPWDHASCSFTKALEP